jgi:hypothetical protein
LTNAWDTVDLLILQDLPERLDDRTLALVEVIAALPGPMTMPVTDQHFNQCMRTLTCLPSRDDDALTARLRLALYRKHFGHLPEEAWSFLVEHATLECRFFPSPAECKAILDRWSRTDGPWRAWQTAHHRAQQEHQARWDDLFARFHRGEVKQDEVDALPDRTKRVAATLGYLREDGTYALRPVRAWGEPEGQGPAVLDEQHTGGTEKAGQPHEGTGL